MVWSKCNQILRMWTGFEGELDENTKLLKGEILELSRISDFYLAFSFFGTNLARGQ